MAIYHQGRPYTYYPAYGGGTIPPHKPGEYRLYTSERKLYYIGETCDLYRRINEHIRSGKLPIGDDKGCYVMFMVADGRSTSKTRREHEKQKIDKHQPSENKSSGGEGRPAGRRSA